METKGGRKVPIRLAAASRSRAGRRGNCTRAAHRRFSRQHGGTGPHLQAFGRPDCFTRNPTVTTTYVSSNNFERQSGSDRLEKQPTDLRQNTSYFGDRTLAALSRSRGDNLPATGKSLFVRSAFLYAGWLCHVPHPASLRSKSPTIPRASVPD